MPVGLSLEDALKNLNRNKRKKRGESKPGPTRGPDRPPTVIDPKTGKKVIKLGPGAAKRGGGNPLPPGANLRKGGIGSFPPPPTNTPPRGQSVKGNIWGGQREWPNEGGRAGDIPSKSTASPSALRRRQFKVKSEEKSSV